jgi:SNF2 family DNA or RNA helicase
MKRASLIVEPYVAGMATAVFPYCEQINHSIKQIPGVRFGSHVKRGAWLVPEEIVSLLEKWAKARSWKIDNRLRFNECKSDLSRLYPPQRPVTEKMVKHGSLLCLAEMGTGKTPISLLALEARSPDRILVVGPALSRRHWRDHIREWYPKHPDIFLAESSKQAATLPTSGRFIIITSYELAHNFVGYRNLDGLVLDEIHFAQDERTKRSATVRKISWRNHDAMRFGLTGTPITANPKGLHHQLHTLWANRFADFFDYNKWYTEIGENEHTNWLFGGINPEHESELRARLDYVTARITKEDLIDYLPDCQFVPLRVPAPARMNVREMLDSFARPDKHNARVRESMLRSTGSTKIRFAVECALDEIQTVDHVAIGAYYHDTGKEIARQLELKSKIPVVYVDGDIPVNKRLDKIAEAAKHKKCFLVATLESVNVSIDLTFNPVSITAELFPVPKTMQQWFGRYDRLSGKIPSKQIILILEGTQDEAIANVLLKRSKDTKKIIRPGRAEKGLLESLEVSEEDFLASIAHAAAERIEEDEYV